MSIGRTHLRDLGRPEEQEEPLAPNYVEERLGQMIDPELRLVGERVPELIVPEPAGHVLSTTLRGREITPEMQVIGALVRRLGGHVDLDAEELGQVQGVVLSSKNGVCTIIAGNGHSE